MGKKNKEREAMTAEQVANAMLAMMLPEVSLGGNWKWYSCEMQEYEQMRGIIERTPDITKYGIHYTKLTDGLLVYAKMEKILSVIDNTSFSEAINKEQVRGNFTQVQEAERREFDALLIDSLKSTGDRLMFGMYLNGFNGKSGVIENKEYRLFKLDAERVFARLYNFWIRNNKRSIYLVSFDGTRKCLDGAFKKSCELRQKQTRIDAKTKAKLNEIGRNALLGGLCPLYAGNALMCCVEL